MNIFKVFCFNSLFKLILFFWIFLEGNKKINRVRNRYGFESLDESSLVLVNLSMTYAIVKLILPLRIGLCLILTPWLSSIITRSLSIFTRLKKNYFIK